MKKKRIQINPVPNDVYEDVGDNPMLVFRFLEELQVEIPANSEFMLLCYKLTSSKFDIRLYGDQEGYLNDYTRLLLKDREDYEFLSYRKDEETEDWEMFLPPPVIGLGLRTKLRPGVSPL